PLPRPDGATLRPGDRAPDCGGLTGDIAAYPVRLFDLLRGRGHVLLVYGHHPAGDTPADLAAAARELSQGRV
ncbi:pentachlorophenol monooxygenase, partial [Streptomyces sp. SID8455]|nr:pentachlorophenol monooxygenase [Streptomyces sp. SID8455]